jgi:hypothetical protein
LTVTVNVLVASDARAGADAAVATPQRPFRLIFLSPIAVVPLASMSINAWSTIAEVIVGDEINNLESVALHVFVVYVI